MNKIHELKITYFILFLILLLACFLRFYDIANNPPGLYIDEASIGYNAYKIVATGRDEYGVEHPLFFKAFGEYKMPLYIYAVSASMKVFGKTEFAIRFPSALAGTLTIFLLYLLVKQLFIPVKKDKKNFLTNNREYIALTSAFILAISPWHLQFSRGGFEATLALFFFMLGLITFLKFKNSPRVHTLLFSVLFLVLPMYTYSAYRIITPCMILYVMGYLFWKKKQWNYILMVVLSSLLLSFSLITFTFTNAGQERFAQTSAFADYKNIPVIEKLLVYPAVFIKNFITFFSIQFLFISGDGFGRHQVPYFALLYIWELPFLIIGLYHYIKLERHNGLLLIYLLLISVFPAALTQPSPHALRFLPAVIPITVFVSLAIVYVCLKKGLLIRAILVIIVVCACYETLLYFHSYYVHYPKTNSLDWGAAYKDTIQRIGLYKNKYPYIIVDTALGNSDIFFKFYSDDIHPLYVSSTWVPPHELDKRKILFVRNGAIKSDGKLIDTIYLKNLNKDPFAKFWIYDN